MTTAALAVSIALPVSLGALSGYATAGQTRGAWYLSLRKPSWQPPAVVFGPVWTALYVTMGVAAWRVWRAGGPAAGPALLLYAVQMALNVAWSFLFFRAHSLRWALADIAVLLVVLVATTASFHGVDPAAGYLMLPYLAWVAFATALTANLYLANPYHRGRAWCTGCTPYG